MSGMGPTSVPGTHRLAPAAHAAAADLLVFNWLPAAYAHEAWLDDTLCDGRAQGRLSRRALCRASASLLQRQGVATRHPAGLQDRRWLLLSDALLRELALELGVAMLGGWVRDGLQREQVAHQRRVLSPAQRAQALVHAGRMRWLPFPATPWPLAADEAGAVLALGASCLAVLLAQRDDGAAPRLALRFAPGTLLPLTLDDGQRAEAAGLVAAWVHERPVVPGAFDGLAAVAAA